MAEPSSVIIPSFNGGELSPRLHGRVDQSVYGIGLETMLGWLPTIQGCAIALPGTHYVETAAGPCRLFPFEDIPTQGYVIEGSELLFRFYTNDVRLGAPYEVAHPWTYDELLQLDYQQSRDVLYLAGAEKQQRKLSRTGAETFSLAALDLANGPFGLSNSDETLTLTASATTGSVTVTASAAAFASTDVGRLIEIEAKDYNDIPSWEPGLTVAFGAKRTWGGKVYQCASNTGGQRTGTAAPIHDSGTEWDGDGTGTDINTKGPYGVKWTFLHGRFGQLKITGFTSATVVTADVQKRLADSLTTTPSWRWALGAFSDTSGWPDVVVAWNECLVWIMGSTGYVSVVGDLENHERRDSSGDFQRDLAGQFTIPGGGTAKWAAADRLLLIGTDKGEYTVERLQLQTGTAGPPVFDVRLQDSNGSRKVKPIQAGGRMLFVQKAGRKLLEFGYAISSDRYQAPDLTRLADHIGGPGFTELAWQAEPERIAWAARGDGTLAGMAYSPDQQVLAWFRRELGGGMLARSICAITDPAGERDQLWIAAETTGGDWFVLRMAKIWETGDDPLDAVYVDAALQYDGAAADEISGLDHIEGETAQILADGKPHPEQEVTGGAVTLGYEAEKATVGLAFPASVLTLAIEAGQSEGTAQGKKKRVIGLRLRVLEAQGIRTRVQDGDWIGIETRVPDDAMDEAVPLYSGDLEELTIGDYETGGRIEIERFQPTPATLLALMPVLEVGE